MAKRLYIVSVYRPDVLDELVAHLGVTKDARVLFDRRSGERRASPRPAPADVRPNERRRASIERALREEGFAIVELTDILPDG